MEDIDIEIPQEKSRERVKIMDVVKTTLRHWPWMIVSLVVCLGIAWLYVKRMPPLYQRQASLVLKDDTGGSAWSKNLGVFRDIGIDMSNSNRNDEVNKFMSPDVMDEVVTREGLYVDYLVDGAFHKDVLYGEDLPVKVIFSTLLPDEGAAFTLDINEQGMFSISDLTVLGEKAPSPKGEFPIGTSINTHAGRVAVVKGPAYEEGIPYKIYVAKYTLEAATARFLGELDVTIKDDKGSTIMLVATDTSPQRAEDIINGVIGVYNERWMALRNETAVNTAGFINDRLGVIESELGNVDRDISAYQSKNLIPNVEQATSLYMSTNKETTTQILELSNQLSIARHLRTLLTGASTRNQTLPSNSGLKNTVISQEINDYNKLMLQRNQLANGASENHPVVADLDLQLADLRGSILSSVDNQISALNTQISALQGSRAETTAAIAASPTQAKYLLSVERQQKVKENLYLYLLQKREENQLAQAYSTNNTDVIMKPRGPKRPVAPNTKKIMLSAFLLGLMMPFGIFYVLELCTTTVRGRKDVEDLHIPFLGEIPSHGNESAKRQIRFSKKNRRDVAQVVVEQGKRDSVNEAFRVLRTNVEFLARKRGEKQRGETIMVTSFNPGSGKTFVAVNLGIALGIKGKRTVVVDCDLRRASTSEYVGKPGKGITDYLIGRTDDINSLMVCDVIGKDLCILPVGAIPPNPTELLETDRFENLVKKLSEEFDYVLLDCPPVEMMADAQIVETMVDRTLFVVRVGLFERAMLPELEKLYDSKKIRNMGLVLNDAKHSAGRYGYGHGYGDYSHYANS